ncbi:MAG: patatin-like phospholipase family protein [Acidobacteriota bacterium]
MAKKKRLNLALQGGGAHGAFTWGVLDRLLEEKDLEFVGISGTSAGAVNGTLLAYGLTIGDFDTTRQVLHDFWKSNSDSQMFSPLQPTIIDKMFSRGNVDYNPLLKMVNAMTTSLSPYQWNPKNFNPLRDLLNGAVDFEALQKSKKIKLYLSATTVRTSKVKIFPISEITADAVLASACLPRLFQGIEIDGEIYWDGGYLGNPAMFPLFDNTDCTDLMLVQIDSTNYNKKPAEAHEIMDRATDLSFNSSLMREMRAIQFVTNIIDKGFDDNGKLLRTFVHHIGTGDFYNDYNNTSKLNVSWDWLTYQRDIGRSKADEWLKENYNNIGVKTSCDMEQLFF